jgi:hypothetical protein
VEFGLTIHFNSRLICLPNTEIYINCPFTIGLHSSIVSTVRIVNDIHFNHNKYLSISSQNLLRTGSSQCNSHAFLATLYSTLPPQALIGSWQTWLHKATVLGNGVLPDTMHLNDVKLYRTRKLRISPFGLDDRQRFGSRQLNSASCLGRYNSQKNCMRRGRDLADGLISIEPGVCRRIIHQSEHCKYRYVGVGRMPEEDCAGKA